MEEKRSFGERLYLVAGGFGMLFSSYVLMKAGAKVILMGVGLYKE